MSSDELNRLQSENAELKKKIAELEQRSKGSAGGDAGELPTAISEYEETLRRLVQRTAMIVQAEKCVIMVRDRENEDLYARNPAFGMTEEQVKAYRVPTDKGISGAVYHSGKPLAFTDSETDTLALEENLKSFSIRNGITVPLLIEKRDDENNVTDRSAVGVLHCFNKRYGGDFIDEDGRLLERLSRNAAAVIANAQMFQEVVEEKQKLVHTLESLTSGLLLINRNGKIAQMNAHARAMFAVPPEANPIGKPYEEIIKQEDCLTILKRQLEDAANPRTLTEEEEEAKAPDEISIVDEEENSYVYQMHAANVRDDSNNPFGLVIIFNDITEIRALERMKTEFVSIVSHELRTPLTPMKGFVRTLLDDEKEEWYTLEDRREFYGIIDENVDRLSRLINDILNVSRIEKGAGLEINWEDVDIRKSVEDVVAMQKGRTDKHTLVVDFEPEHIIAETDADKIQNILHNLISNAIKYAPDGGEVRIIGRILPATEEYPESLLLGVKDQGMGIPESYLKKLGDKFVRVDNKSTRKAGGTGIGLYLVKGIIGAHKGQMWPESEGMGKGSTFWVRFPIKQSHIEGETAQFQSDGK